MATPYGAPFVGVALAQSHKPVFMTRLFTGPDNLTHSEEVAIEFPGGVSKLLPITSGELHLASPGNVIDWHRAPRRQYVITLTGHAEIEVAGEKKFLSGRGTLTWLRTPPAKDTSRKSPVLTIASRSNSRWPINLANRAGK